MKHRAEELEKRARAGTKKQEDEASRRLCASNVQPG